jgi:hypothetical protein
MEICPGNRTPQPQVYTILWLSIFYLNKKLLNLLITQYKNVNMEDDYFTVNISVSDLEVALANIINSPHKKIIAEAIISNLKHTPKGCSHVYMSLCGVKEISPFKIGDHVLIKLDYIPGWRIDKTKFVEGDNLFQGKVKGVVVGVDITESDPVKVEFQAVPSGKQEKESHDYSFNYRQLELDLLDFLVD